MSNLFCSPLFYIFLTLFTYTIFSFIYHKCKFPLFNPLLLTSIVIILYLLITKYSVNSYTDSLSIVNIFLSPLTVCLAIPVFNRIQIVKHYFLPIVVGTIIGAIVSIGSVLLFGKMLHLDQEIIMSMIPKSVTTPIALEISEKLGGIKGITVSAVILTGISGALVGPLILKLFHIKRSPAIGMSLGGTSHAVGTSKAVEISARAGAISSVAIVTSGIVTVILSLFL